MISTIQTTFDHEVCRFSTRVVFTVIITFGFSAWGYAQSHGCPIKDAMNAETEASSLKNWHAVFDSYKRYWRCDDAAIAEGYSASVATLLADQWEQFGQLVTLSRNNRRFQDFVLRHIDATMGSKQYTAIKKNVRSRCPPDGTALCRLIDKRLSATGLKGDED